jgi:hypothetical protein
MTWLGRERRRYFIHLFMLFPCYKAEQSRNEHLIRSDLVPILDGQYYSGLAEDSDLLDFAASVVAPLLPLFFFPPPRLQLGAQSDGISWMLYYERGDSR